MSKFVPVLVRLPAGVAQEVKAHCARSGMSISEGLRALVMQACREGLSENRVERELDRIGDDLNFTAVALDALLAGHPDPGLRARAHEAFDRKLARRRGASASGQGGVS